jgi:hypothetical protein
MKQLPDDFREFLSLLNEKQVEYLVVGGWALGVHGYVRATGDMDIWVGSNETNLDRLLTALFSFGVPKEVTKEFFMEEGNVFRMGTPPMRIEIITEATGVKFTECFSRRMEIVIDDLPILIISYDDFVINKRSSRRLKDLADLESLGEDIG